VTRSYDIHAHCVVPEVWALVEGQEGRAADAARQAAGMGPASAALNARLAREWGPLLIDPAARLAAMDRMGLDVQAVSPAPTEYHYWAEPSLAADVCRALNEGVAAHVAAAPDRLVGLGMIALQHPDLAAEQLRAAVRDLGLRGAMISTNVDGTDLSDERLTPVWAAAEELGAVLFLHPWGCTLGERLDRSYLYNVVGNPTETTVALSHLIFGGVLDRHPRLRVCAAHGGGYLPYYPGRSDHAHRAREDSRSCARPPSEYLRDLWFDTVVHDPVTLRHLIDRVGMSQVVLGTDHPFDMGLDDPLGLLDAVPGLTPEERDAVAGTNAERLLAGPVA
jgi:aminocarboxymuconate-semialdehyde decarboxylase